MTAGRVASMLVVAASILFAYKMESVVAGLEIFWKTAAMMGVALWVGLFSAVRHHRRRLGQHPGRRGGLAVHRIDVAGRIRRGTSTLASRPTCQRSCSGKGSYTCLGRC